MGDVIEVDFVERKRKKVLREIKDEAEREMKLLANLMGGGDVAEPIPEGLVMPLPDDGLDHD